MNRLAAYVVPATLFLVTIFSLAAGAQTTGTGSTAAQTGRIAIMDLATVIDESQAGIEANDELNALIQARQSTLDAMVTEIEALEAQVEEAKANNGNVDELRQQLDALIDRYISLHEQYELEIQQFAEMKRNQILAEIAAVLQWFGDNTDYVLILDSSAALYYRHEVDITREIIRYYNQLREQNAFVTNDQPM